MWSRRSGPWWINDDNYQVSSVDITINLCDGWFWAVLLINFSDFNGVPSHRRGQGVQGVPHAVSREHTICTRTDDDIGSHEHSESDRFGAGHRLQLRADHSQPRYDRTDSGGLLYILMHPIFTFPAAYVIDTFGAKAGIMLGSVLGIVGVSIRLLVNSGFWLVIIGQVLAGIGRPFIMNCQAKISANWFHASKRVHLK